MSSRLYAYTLRHTLKVAALVAGSLVTVAAISYGLVQLFTIQQVYVDGAGITISIDQYKIGHNLLLLQTDTLTHELLSAYPLLSSVKFEKRYPGTLIIHLIKREPSVLLNSQSAWYLLDSTGVVLQNGKGSEPYPRFYFDVTPISIGARIADQRVVAALAMLRMSGSTVGITSIKEQDATSLQATVGESSILFPQTGDIGAKATTLQTIVEGFRIKGALPSVIDLRYAKPIVTN